MAICKIVYQYSSIAKAESRWAHESWWLP